MGFKAIYYAVASTRQTVAKKKELRRLNFPREAVLAYVENQYRRESFEGLAGQDNAYLVMPSTSGENAIPYVLAGRLKRDFGGCIIEEQDYAYAIAEQEAKAKAGYIKKLRAPSEFVLTHDLHDLRDRNVVLVDDILTSGETAEAMAERLVVGGLSIFSLAVLAAAYEGMLARPETIQKLAETLAEKLDCETDELYCMIQEAHPLAFDNLLVKCEHEANRSKPKAKQIHALIKGKAAALRKAMGRRASPPPDGLA